MNKKPSQQIGNVEDFLKEIPDFPDGKTNLSESTQNLLRLAYEKAYNLPKKALNKPLKAPLIISFHPKMSLLNNNIHETYLAEKVAKKLGMIPIWMPYVYDTGYKTAANKIRLPTYVYFEGKYLPLRASAKIRGNIMATEKPISEKEIKTFFRELEKHENSSLTQLKNMLNPFNFGHHLFDIKKKLSAVNKKGIRKKIEGIQKEWIGAVKSSKKLAESLAKISMVSFEKYGIDVALLMIDDVLQEIATIVFKEILATKSVKKDPSLLENLFLAYNLKTKERSQIMYTGDNYFIAFDEYDVKTFDGSTDDLMNGLGNHTVLPTGHLIMLLFTAMGCKLVLGGAHTMEYYPDYFEKANTLLKETTFNNKMVLLSYGKIRFMDLRNMNDILSVVRILDKVGSRNYMQKGKFILPDDIVDHLNFLEGKEAVPKEYSDKLDAILKNEKPKKEGALTAIKKEVKRNKEVAELVLKPVEDLLKDPSYLKKWIRGTKFDDIHPVRLEVLLENLRLDADMRLRKLQENIEFEKHILGGSVKTIVENTDGAEKDGEDEVDEDDEKEEIIIYDGILKRSNRYPSIFEMVYYDSKPQIAFESSGTLVKHENEWIWLNFNHVEEKLIENSELSFEDYEGVFKHLISKDKLIPFLQ